jgi:hypothetical protein
LASQSNQSPAFSLAIPANAREIRDIHPNIRPKHSQQLCEAGDVHLQVLGESQGG